MFVVLYYVLGLAIQIRFLWKLIILKSTSICQSASRYFLGVITVLHNILRISTFI